MGGENKSLPRSDETAFGNGKFHSGSIVNEILLDLQFIQISLITSSTTVYSFQRVPAQATNRLRKNAMQKVVVDYSRNRLPAVASRLYI